MYKVHVKVQSKDDERSLFFPCSQKSWGVCNCQILAGRFPPLQVAPQKFPSYIQTLLLWLDHSLPGSPGSFLPSFHISVMKAEKESSVWGPSWRGKDSTLSGQPGPSSAGRFDAAASLRWSLAFYPEPCSIGISNGGGRRGRCLLVLNGRGAPGG